ncbi:PREDICTED: leucine-rich repeat-containing protein 15-like [Branchiostoma belcheri]|uniref:Leucine-rich repeat-containing protein 15-like n=1 Tax=Branchiostoma belcheri TaxID=7741 RepID=A0A6P4Y3K9_BRABE|nr:PREDICTED: leucine-rich repeat-containing protein 15-like [Branchiostoma belcheri]
MFTGLGNLEELGLSHNDISDIQAGTFNSTSQLRTLHLSNNKLTVLRTDMFTGLGNLVRLYLHSNNINDIQDHTFNPTPQLKFLNLNNNHIQVFPFEDLLNIQTIVTLHLDKNQMTTLPSVAYDILSSISNVKIDNNPWQCDCRMVDFRLKMTGTYPFENQTICSQPDHLRGQKLIDVSPEHLMSYCVPTIVRFERGDNMTLLNSAKQP